VTIYFSSDHHFDDAHARTFYRRPFATVTEMNQTMIERWNATVEPDDDVWHLGDFAVRQSAEQAEKLLNVLHGHKHLVIGNNDAAVVATAREWRSVQPYAEITVDGKLLVLCHYAFRTWRDMGKGAINLHGHSHGRLKPLPRQYDVGVDVWDFRPVSLADIIAGFYRRPA
jgi:calcineurin-like phosphoesterase family protein